MKKFLFFFFLIAIVLTAWILDDPTIEIINPDGINDGNVFPIPIKVVVKQYNSQGLIDYAKYYLVEDTDTDGIIDQSEWDNRMSLGNETGIKDINRQEPFTISYLGESKVKQDKYYFIIGVGIDLSGNTSCDTSLIVGETCEGGGASGISDKAIAYFKVKRYRP